MRPQEDKQGLLPLFILSSIFDASQMTPDRIIFQKIKKEIGIVFQKIKNQQHRIGPMQPDENIYLAFQLWLALKWLCEKQLKISKRATGITWIKSLLRIGYKV